MQSKKSIHLCFVGNMLGRNSGYITTQGEIVADLFDANGYKVTSVSSKINRLVRLLEIILTLIKSHRKFDVVVIDIFSGMSFIISDIAGALCKLFKLPVIMVLRGGSLPKFTKKYPRWAKRVLDRADILVAPSAFMAEKIGTWGYEIVVIPNVISIENYPYQERTKISPKLIWMRSFHPIYNPEMAVKVLAKLKRIEPEATLTMAGADKGLEEGIRNLVVKMGLKDSVRFAGFLDLEKKTKEFSKADIYLNTNRVDNMPVSVVEARALGLPVVATEVGGVPYLVTHEIDGMLSPNEDVDAMVNNIIKLLENPDLTRKISKNGRILAEKSSWKSVKHRFEQLFETVLVNKSFRKSAELGFEK